MIYYQDEFITLYHGDSRDVLPTLESEIVQTCVTSPPFGLRNYGVDAMSIFDDAQKTGCGPGKGN